MSVAGLLEHLAAWREAGSPDEQRATHHEIDITADRVEVYLVLANRHNNNPFKVVRRVSWNSSDHVNAEEIITQLLDSIKREYDATRTISRAAHTNGGSK